MIVNRLEIMATSPSSVHSPIAERTIRLLQLEAGSADDPIRISLESISLHSNPTCEAISYCWGDAKAHRDITCQGFAMSINTSLWGAPREFRHRFENHSLSADSVCINQQDKKEKMRQVRIMPEAYAKAKLVLVWLDPMDEAGLLSNVYTSIKELHEFFPSFDDKVIVSPEARQNLVAEMALRDRRESWPNTDEYDLEPLVEFIGRPWLTRK
ncbi:hypothetical protein J7T55_000724 [Diaporthe amygdali]|uniref:uncharacterized protein n=1 Tax=Phomopsis amygdali TaxID=1214568 RepID=UPI0022FEA1E5|nr:uncharacterized protein J7T55_000724 [Diaporthe amygdali]KAJ0110291.1 hypothetical protein J7T55_000724 [Diaporthe amygdali]